MKKIITGALLVATLSTMLTVGYLLATKKPVKQTLSLYVEDVKEIASSISFRTNSKKVNFTEDFTAPLTVEESWPMSKSGNTNWWVSSGAYLYFENGTGKTVVGNLPSSNSWVARFAAANATDTDNGTRPQNIFRLVLKKTAKNFTQSAYYRITQYEVSPSSNRNASNGILLFNRYQDDMNLYYTGVRVDGQVVVKKKLAGTYTTLATSKLFDGQYDIQSNPNLIPLNTWIGVKSEVSTDSKGLVHIKVYTDVGKTGVWTLATEAIDDGKTYGSAITNAGNGGIRTDFMDVEFDNYTFVSQ
jgi:hypothetical protein